MSAYRLATVFALAQLGLALTAPARSSSTRNEDPSGVKDSTSARALKHLVAVSSPNMTVESCLDSCAAGGYILAGVEFGDECYCGNALLYVYGVSEACDMACSGNTSEFCGGPKALNLYQFADMPFTTGPSSTVFFIKPGSGGDVWSHEMPPGDPRLLPHRPLVAIAAEQMTVERCLDGCAAAEYNAAGLEAGQECFCDLVPNDIIQPQGWESTNTFECALPCLANASEVCGGTNPDSGDTEGRISGYLTCEAFGRC
ncbi:WSC domain-containing protein [Mycena capillaripes]|nr:WSC domain-containing protein [Mycena capillaripes]